MDTDAQHLRLLSIFHYVVGGMVALFGCFALIYVGFGIAMLVGAIDTSGPNPPPPWLGWIMIIVGAGILVVAWAFAACLVVAGRKLAARRNYWFCFIIACIECCYSPFGTVLGVLTQVTLLAARKTIE